MAEQSSYVKYLPTVLWARENDPQQLLGQFLRIFEKILTGLPDGVPIGTQARAYPPLEQLIDELPQLFNPWHTRTEYLPWLASWVALTLQPTWSEHQQRKAIADIVSIYHLRGLNEGLHAYLEIFSLTQSRPRIAIDEGNALLRARFADDGTARLHTVVHSHTITLPAVPAAPTAPARPVSYAPVLIHPAALAADQHNAYFVVDQGIDNNSDIAALRRPALWKLASTGELPYGGNAPVPLPQPLQTGIFFHYATAAVVDRQNRCNVISYGAEPSAATSQNSVLQRFAPPKYTTETLISQATTPKLPVVRPVDMCLDQAGNLVILDRGTHGDPSSAFAAKTKLVIVSENPLTAVAQPLNDVVEPTAIVLEPAGTFIVADARNQFPNGSEDNSIWEPADLVRVDPANNWAAISLLSALPAGQNPLIFPTGLAFESPQVLLVCDTGLRWGFDEDPSNRTMAEPAALYRVDLTQSPPQITRITYDHALVNPTKLMIDQAGHVIIADRGEALRDSFLQRNWRARPNEFGVIVHFSRQRPTDNDERNRTRRGITSVVEEQKPAHTAWWLKSA